MGYPAIKIFLLRAADIGWEDSLCFANRFSCSVVKVELVKQNDPPNYPVTGEGTLGTLVIRGEPLNK